MNNIEEQKQLSQQLKKKAQEEGFSPVGIAKIPGSKRIQLRTAALERWLEAGYQADMNWMKADRRKQIQSLLKGVNSVLVVGLNYYIDIKRKPETLAIARYAWGKDYHKIIEQRLKRIGAWLENQRPNCNWKVCVDSQPLLDKVWAEEAGLGWIGKHSNIINSKSGSWIVLGHLLCTEPLIADKPSKALCGKCEKCMVACPTQAISEPFVVDANRCLAYHTIENRDKTLPQEITESIDNWIAGCDICQDVCPWNQKKLQSSSDKDVQPKEWILNLTKQKAVAYSDDQWREKTQDSALKRIKPWMWRRNAISIQTSNLK